ncbi:MAG TPA: TonB-dependent receptor, partial [Gammaproteobacteria bacterium]|nr:TonB-dependent receptor [Gammaproteobacteria bacterium]
MLISIGTPPLVLAASGEELVGMSLEAALSEFERQGLRLFYSSDLVRASMRIEAAPTQSDPAKAVTEILAPHGLTLRRGLDNTWLVVRNPEGRRQPIVAVTGPETPDSDTFEPWIPPPIEELIVAASKYEMFRSRPYTQQLIGQRDLEYMPEVGDDVIRAVARLPGIASNGLSAVSHFRGGELSETLVRLDGMRLYDPFHLRDFQAVFSAIDPRIVSSMNIYTGGFPAVYGDRMSGVVDVETMTVEQDTYHEIGASFFNSSLLSSGRFASQRGEWIVSARRSNLDLLYRNFSEQPDRPRYSDLFAKVGFDVSDKLAISANVLRAEDNIKLADDVDREERASAHQLDAYAWLKLEHSPGPLTSGSTLLARTTIDGSRTGESEKSGISAGWLSDLRSFSISTLQSDWSRLVGQRMLLDFGGSISRQHGSYEYDEEVEFEVLFDVPGASEETSRSRAIAIEPHGRQYTFYTTLRVDWTPVFTSDFGLRWHQQKFNGVAEATRGPRVGLRFAVSDRSTLRASWGRFYQSQAVNELQVSDGSTRFYPSQRSEQIVIGFDRLFPNGTILRLEAYEKDMRDLRPRYENLLNARVLLPELKPDRLRIAPDS